MNTSTLITSNDLQQKADEAMKFGLASPKDGWTIMVQVEKDARSQDNPFLAAQAAFHLGRLANEYGRPRLAELPLNRAEELFTTLNEPGWLAAVAWQGHALPWASANLFQAVEELESAVRTLQSSPAPLNSYAPLCRLTLAYARLLKDDYDSLPDLIQQCLDHFTNTNDILHLARTHFVRSGYLRRTAPFEEAKNASFEGLALAQSINAAADIGRFHCQIGFNHWLCDGNYEAAAQSFQQGIDQFQALDIPGWLGQCQTGLAEIHIMTGRLTDASNLLESAIQNFEEEKIDVHLSICYLDAGWLEMLKGRYHESIYYLNKALNVNKKGGRDTIVAISHMHLGDTYLQLGHLQLALQHLEHAYGRFEKLGLSYRLAECSLRLAHTWTILGNHPETSYWLGQVKKFAQKSSHTSALLAFHFRTAEHATAAGDLEKALQNLNEALFLATQQKNPAVEASCHRQIARIYTRQEKLDQAIQQLACSEKLVNEMGFRHEQADRLLIRGDIYSRQGRQAEAVRAWQESDHLTREIMPDLNWQAAAALAQLTEETGQPDAALAHYRQMIAALRLLRQGFWQPELAGSYLQRPFPALRRAIFLSAQHGRPQETLTYIEEAKAQTTARRIQAQALLQEFNSLPANIQALTAEIRWLQQYLNDTSTWQRPLFRSAEYDATFRGLQDKIAAYTTALNRLQREQLDSARLPLTDSFNQDHFYNLAHSRLGNDWVALDYFFDGSNLICLELSPSGTFTHPIALPDGFWEAVEGHGLTRGQRMPPFSMLKAAGKTLLPTAVCRRLLERQSTTLLIAPHGDLHRLPWSALHLDGADYHPLIEAADPVIIPSLQTLSLLWQRPSPEANIQTGLLTAVSEFGGRYPDLTAVSKEAESLKPYLGENGRTLLDHQATAPALSTALGSGQRYDFWHIATHAFHDTHSGRFSGIALHDRDFLLDELWQLAPLPPLVTLSACAGSKSYLIEGDEHIGFATACLSAGANHIIGSIWDIPDQGTPDMMIDFYTRLRQMQQETTGPASQSFEAMSFVAKALAQAQRRTWANGGSWQQWAGFRCTGRR